MRLKKIIINLGDPSGIGPDLCVKLATQKFNAILIVIGNKKAIENRAKMLNQKIIITNKYSPHQGNSSLTIIDTSYPYSVIPGKPNKANSYAQFKQINFIVNELIK
jgi:4-hydroxythreonine-4-phosphate dehydrogenase